MASISTINPAHAGIAFPQVGTYDLDGAEQTVRLIAGETEDGTVLFSFEEGDGNEMVECGKWYATEAEAREAALTFLACKGGKPVVYGLTRTEAWPIWHGQE